MLYPPPQFFFKNVVPTGVPSAFPPPFFKKNLEGYGDKYVEENCLAGTVIMLVQELLGQLLDCFWIG